jgi:hypothetical protein
LKKNWALRGRTPVTGMMIRDTLFHTSLTDKISRLHHTAISHVFYEGFHDFAICDINPTVGKGVFYKPAKKGDVLKKGTIVGVYTGSLTSANTDGAFYPYGYKITRTDIIPQSAFHPLFGIPFYNAEKNRNATSFAGHALTDDELQKLDILEQLKRNIATANIGVMTICQFGIPILIFVIMRDMFDGEQWLIDYGNYWGSKKNRTGEEASFQLFDVKAQTMGTLNTENQFTLNPDYVTDSAPPAPRCNATAEQEMKGAIERQEGQFTKNSSQYFLTSVRFAIENFRKRRRSRNSKTF